MHDFNANKCRLCSKNGLYEVDERTDELVKTADLLICLSCRNVKYCCKEHQVEDWPNHKKFCKRFRKVITEYKTLRDSRPRGSPKPPRPTPYPLHDFIRRGDWRGLLKYVTDDHPTYNEIDSRSPEFMSPLVLACGQGRIECVQILLDHGANYTDECVSSNMTPLIYASWWGHDDIVQLLINHGADVNYTNAHLLCALLMASQHLQPEVVKVLLRHGANVDQRNYFGWTPLISTVCMSGTDQPGGDDERTDLQRNVEDNPKIVRIVKMLLEAGADINARGAAFGAPVGQYKEDTALNMCSDKIEILELLISEGALLDVQRESDGRNALLAAAEHKRTADLELLIRSGADITVRDNNGRNYLDWLEIPWTPEE